MNKIVEILEKAKSCYWPALQNVYMNVTQGEPDAIHEAPGPIEGGVSAHSWEENLYCCPYSPSPFSADCCVPSYSGLKEANDIVLYLKPLRILLEEMEQADFTVVC